MILEPGTFQWLVLILLVWVISLTVLVVQSLLHYRRLSKNVSKKDLKTILTQILNQIDLNQKEISAINLALTKTKIDLKTAFQKIGFVRFNPFSQTGGDQSFCLALLDDRGSGIILSSLHSRDNTRLYAKTIKNNKAEGYELSKEELKAIQYAK